MAEEQWEQVLELAQGWSAADHLEAVTVILCNLTGDEVIDFWDREELIRMTKAPCDALLVNLVEKEGRIGLIVISAILYLLDILRQCVVARAKKKKE